MTTIYFRRDFLKKVSAFAGTMILTPFVANSITGINQPEDVSIDRKLTPRINPAFRMNLSSDGSLELFTFQKPGSKISFHYSGFEVAILLIIAEDKPPDTSIKELASQYSLSDSVCKGRICSAMDEFKRKGLIYYGDLMLVKKTDSTYE